MHIILVYIGIFFGLFLEGEMILISAVIAAHHGYLIFWIVVILGLAGTYSADCLYFFLGRKRGYVWINKNPKIKKKAEIIEKKIEKYPIIIFLSYRFLYGFRTITPLVIGAGKTKTKIFLLFSAISTIAWATIYCSVGYLFGTVIKSELGHIEHIEKYIIGVLILIGILFIMLKYIKRKDKENLLKYSVEKILKKS
jgi:membrane protein DedA with SNARE-associated domain